MRHVLRRPLAVALLSAALIPPAIVGASAQGPYHHRHHHDRSDAIGHTDRGARGPGSVNPAYGYAEAPYDPAYAGPGAIVFNATRRAAHEPGVTRELAPDAKETATGGPSGGVPGFDGS